MSKFASRIVGALAVCAALLFATANVAHAQSAWPNRPVTWLQPYAPGSATDLAARFIGERLTRQWGQPVVADYKPGANNVIGTEMVARAAPDGYTFMVTAPGHFSNEVLVPKLPYDPVKAFVPVAKFISLPLILVVPSTSPFRSVKDLVDFARKNPGKLSYSTGGTGSSQHLAGAMLATLADINVLHIPYKAQSAAVVDVASGQVDFAFVAVATAASQIAGGKLRALAASGSTRSASFPDLPTMAEAGVPNFSYAAIAMLFAPTGTPPEIVAKVSSDIGAVTRTPEFAELARQNGFNVEYSGGAEWANALPTVRRQWIDLVKKSGAAEQR